MTAAASPARVDERLLAFGTLQIAFDDQVLSPRAWTVEQAHWAADLLGGLPPGPVLELCAGVGHIGLLAAEDSDRPVVLVDVNPVACHWARINAERAWPSAVEVREADLADALEDDETFPLIIADPPWVATDDVLAFPDDPRVAIDGGDDGLDMARRCLEVIEGHLAPGGVAVLQLGTTSQVAALKEHAALLHSDLAFGETRELDGGVLTLIGWSLAC